MMTMQAGDALEKQMADKAFFVVRATVADASLRARFDHWYSTDHLPWAVRVFKAEKAWRLWSDSDPSVHVAVYRFADKGRLEAALQSEDFKALVADFDRSWPSGITRTRELLTLVETAPA
jgi:hypothetical protein